MKLSIFTPTHRPELLIDAWESFQTQIYQGDWEWIIVLNGEAKATQIHNDIAMYGINVMLCAAPDFITSMGVGALKRYACEKCTGDVLIELDHDDRFLPTALEKIAKAFELGADFVSTDFANVRDNGESQIYDKAYGWESYLAQDVKGQPVTAMSGFDVNAASLHRIFYAPNHFRAWTRDAYWKAGGHNPNLGVTDDHDLVIRTYLNGAKFYHIPECLYIYRMHEDGQQTFLQRNAEIQIRQEENSKRYLHQLVAEEMRRKGLPMLDLGARIGKAKGYQSVDLTGADINWDIMTGLPFADNSVGCIRAFDFLEHIPHCRDSRCLHRRNDIIYANSEIFCVVGLMNEIYRVLVPGGWLLTGTPSSDGRGAFQDPSHCSFWNPNSFWYYTRAEQAKYINGLTARFQNVRTEQRFPSDWHRNNNIPYVYADLVALKGQRQPGIKEW